MLWYFPDLYPDEILYSGFARYHFYSGNTSYRDTLLDLFGTDNTKPSIILPSHLKYFSNQLRHESYSLEKVINNHTLIPYYRPFISAAQFNDVIEQVAIGNTKGLFNALGLACNRPKKKNDLYY
tara:strand:- start:495 stop:866 length:372 start_codon:yes stop_codon:yes gene_type:complete